MVWDFVNYTVEFAVEDAETGEDLLDSATEGNILGQEIKVIYNEKEYPRWTKDGLQVSDIENLATTRYNMPMPFALRWGWSNSAYSTWWPSANLIPLKIFIRNPLLLIGVMVRRTRLYSTATSLGKGTIRRCIPAVGWMA